MRKLFLHLLVALLLTNYASAQALYNWAKSFGSLEYDVANGVCVDEIGNVYHVGRFQNTIDFDPGPGVENRTADGIADLYLAKHDSSGNLLWVRTMGGEGYHIAYDPAGYVCISGLYNGTIDLDPGPGIDTISSPLNNLGYFLVKFDADGNFIWGNAINELVRSLAINSTSDIIVLTQPWGLVSSAIMKYNSFGDTVYYRSIQGDVDAEVKAYSLSLDSMSNIYIAGNVKGDVDLDPSPNTAILTGDANRDMFFAKYDSAGNYLWAKLLSDTNPTTSPTGGHIGVTASGSIYIVGGHRGATDFDPSAGVQMLYAGTDLDQFLAHYDTDGNFIFVKSDTGQGYFTMASIAFDEESNIHISGELFYGVIDMDLGPGTYYIAGSQGGEGYVARYDSAGNFKFAYSMDDGYAWSLACDDKDHLYAAGYAANTTDVGLGSGPMIIPLVGWCDIIVAKYNIDTGTLTQGVRESQLLSNIMVYPNPVDDILIIRSTEQVLSVDVMDVSGRVLFSTAEREVDMRGYSTGVYFIKVHTAKGSVTKKILKE